MFVEVDADEHPENAQNIDFQVESQDEFDQHEVDGQRWVDPWIKIRRENALNGALRRHDMENLSEYPAEEPSDQYEDK